MKAEAVTHLRDRALRAFAAGVAAADPGVAVTAALTTSPPPAPKGRRIVISVGKAAPKMAKAALAVLDPTPDQTICVTNYENDAPVSGAKLYLAGHPVPDSNGQTAANAIRDLVSTLSADDQVIALVSGGASALLPAPADGITLADKIAVNTILLENGFDITQTNMVRQALSFLKGGGLARLAAPAKVFGFILSDVIGDDINVIASGPTARRIGTRQEAFDLLEARGVADRLPASVARLLATAETPPPAQHAQNILIGSNTQSARAMALAAEADLSPLPLIGDVGDAVTRLMADIRSADLSKPLALAWGGETTVNVTGNGRGGRNQDLALRFALAATQTDLPAHWCLLSGATDGRDGPTQAAGGLVDPMTIGRLIAAGGDARAILADSNSNHGLELSGDLIVIGATGTNVADLQLFLSHP